MTPQKSRSWPAQPVAFTFLAQLKRWWGGNRRALVDQYVNTGRPQIELPSQPAPVLRTGALAVYVTTTSGWLAMIVVGTQVYRFRDQGQRTTHAGVS